MVKKRRMKRGRKEIATKEKRRIKREIAEKDNKNSDDSTQSINRAHPPSAPEIPRHQGPGVLKIGVVHKEERDLKTG